MEKKGKKKSETKIVSKDVFKSKTIDERHENIIRIMAKYINQD